VKGCTPGLVHRWSWWSGWTEEYGYGEPPEDGDIAVHARTGSCYLVLRVKPSRKGRGWYSLQMEGLGVDAAELGDDGTFGYTPLTGASYDLIRQVEQIERAKAGDVTPAD
jgi:hypothetical protein